MANKLKKSSHPFILIGTNLYEIYDQLEFGLKKNVSLVSGIEDSNIKPMLNVNRNICKDSFRKLSDGLEVYPVIFYVSKDNIQTELIDCLNENGTIRLSNFNELLKVMNLSDTIVQDIQSDDSIINTNTSQLLDSVFDKIKLKCQKQLNKEILVKKTASLIDEFTTSVLKCYE